jgi:LPXTG-motif cell wall-anchored protein
MSGTGPTPVSKERSVRKITVLGASALLVAGLMVSPAAAFAAPVLTDTEDFLDGVKVCEGYDSGKIDTEGDPESVTFEAPAGELISGYCVKAGSTKQGEDDGGAYFVTLDDPAPSVTITYPWGGGRAVSHYAVQYVDGTIEPTPSPTPSVPSDEPTDEPSGTPTPSAMPTEDGTEPTDEPDALGEDVDATPSPSATEPPVLAATGASTAIGFTLIALALVGGGVTLIVLRRKGVLGS